MSVSDFPCTGNEGAAPRRLADAVDGVSSWWCPLVAGDEAMAALGTWLSVAELERAARFGTELLARRYRIGRAALRWVLAQQLDVAPSQVPIERGARGRPQIAGGTDIDFNVSHTGSVALIGVVASVFIRIGVDVERSDRVLNHLGLARRFLNCSRRAGTAPRWN